MKFYTSDLHFNHTKIIEYCNRPFNNIEDMNNTIVNNWNNKVSSKDDVYILGDFGFLKGSEANKFLSLLNGNKYLIIGNHDIFLKDKSFDKSLLKDISYYREIKDNKRKVVLFHYPIFHWNGLYYNSIHLFGHVHNSGDFYNNVPDFFKNKAFNVGVDVNNFQPVSLEEILERENK